MSKFIKEDIKAPVNFAKLEHEATYFVYFYRIGDKSKIVLSETITKENFIMACNQAIDAIKDLKRDVEL